jgi:hypothetical protein
MNNLNRQINNRGVKFTYQIPGAPPMQRVVNVVPTNMNTATRFPNMPTLGMIEEEK